MATFQGMASMMKNMKPEDIVTIIGLVQSGKLTLQEDELAAGAGAGDVQDVSNSAGSSQHAVLQSLQQIEAQMQPPRTETVKEHPEQGTQVVDSSYGGTHRMEDDELASLSSRHATQLRPRSDLMPQMVADQVYMRRLTGQMGSEYDSSVQIADREQLLTEELIAQLKQKIALGQADENTIQTLAQLGKQLRARQTQSLRRGSSSQSRPPWADSEEAGLSSSLMGGTGPPLTGVDTYASLQSGSLVGQPGVDAMQDRSQIHTIPGLHTLEQQMQDQQKQNVVQHQALLQQMRLQRQQQSSVQVNSGMLTQDFGHSEFGGIGNIQSLQVSDMGNQALLGQSSQMQMQQQSLVGGSGMATQDFRQSGLEAAGGVGSVLSQQMYGADTNIAAERRLQLLQSLQSENASVQALQMQSQLSHSLSYGSASLSAAEIQAQTGQVATVGDAQSVQALEMQAHASQGVVTNQQPDVLLLTQQTASMGTVSLAQPDGEHPIEARAAQILAQQQSGQETATAGTAAFAQSGGIHPLIEVEERAAHIQPQQQANETSSNTPLPGQAVSNKPVPLMDIQFHTGQVPPRQAAGESKKRKLESEGMPAQSQTQQTASKQRKTDTAEKVLLIKKCTWCSSDKHLCKNCPKLKGSSSSNESKTENKKTTEQKGESQEQIKEKKSPSVELTKEKKSPSLEQTKEKTSSSVEQSKEKTSSSVEQSKEKTSPSVEQSKEKTTPSEEEKAKKEQARKELLERIKKELSQKIQQMKKERKTKDQIKQEIETNLNTLKMRLRDTDQIKGTRSYKNYEDKVLRGKGKTDPPKLPDVYSKYKSGVWEDKIKHWHKLLKQYEPSEPASTSQSKTSQQPPKCICHPCQFHTTDVKIFEAHIVSRQHRSKFQGRKHKPRLVQVRCTSCNATFSSVKKYEEHNADQKAECNLKKKMQGAQSKGAEVKTMSKKYSCDVCNVSFTDLKFYLNHVESDYHKGMQVFVCTTCNVRFRSSRIFQRHLESENHCSKLGNKLCPICEVVYPCNDINNSKKHFESSEHMAELEKKRKARQRLECKYCQVSCSEWKSFQQHLLGSKHFNKCKGQPHVECPVCNLYLTNVKAYWVHLKTKSHQDKIHAMEQKLLLPKCFVCTKCNFKFQDATEYKQHLESTEVAQQHQLICISCNFLKFPDAIKYREHLKSKEHLSKTSGPPSFVCTKCNFKFQDAMEYKQHLESTEVARQHQLICSSCNFLKLPDADKYKEHLKSEEHLSKTSEPQLFVCTKCNFKCRDAWEYKQHMESKKVAEQHKLICTTCTSKFLKFSDVKKYKEHLKSKEHQSKLSGVQKLEQPVSFVCIPCDFKCRNSKEYEEHLQKERHIKKVLNKLNTSKFGCSKCHVNFPGFDRYEQHLLSPEHIEKMGGHFVCHLCDKKFQTFIEYEKHMSSTVHTQEVSSFGCIQCRVSFKGRKAFDTHIDSDYHKLVTKIKEQKLALDECKSCNIKFSDLKSFGEHIQDGEHISIMTVSGIFKCLLCPWRPSSNYSPNAACKFYLEHVEAMQHMADIDQLWKTYGTFHNILAEGDKLYCADCKAHYSGNAESHKCPIRNKNDPRQLCTIVVEEKAAVASCSQGVLTSFFRQFGDIADVSVVKQPKLHRTHITYRRIRSANDAMDLVHLGSLSIKGTRLSLTRELPSQFPESKTADTLFYNNEVKDVNRVDLFNYFLKYGKIKEIVRIPHDKELTSGFGYIVFDSKTSVRKAFVGGIVVDRKSTHQVLKQPVVCYTLITSREANCKILLKNIPPEMSSADLEAYFGCYGTVDFLRVVRDMYKVGSTGYGSVMFEYRKPADAVIQYGAVHRYNGKEFECVRNEQDISKETVSSEPQEAQAKMQVDSKPQQAQTKMQEEADNMMVVEEWFEGDLEEDDIPDAESEIPGVGPPSPPPSPPSPDIADITKSKWDDESDFIDVEDADCEKDVEIISAMPNQGISPSGPDVGVKDPNTASKQSTSKFGPSSSATLATPGVVTIGKSSTGAISVEASSSQGERNSSTSKVSKSVTFKVPESRPKAGSNPPTFKVPQMMPPTKTKKDQSSKPAIKGDTIPVTYPDNPYASRSTKDTSSSAVVLRMSGVKAPDSDGKEKQMVVRGILENQSIAEPQGTTTASKTTFILKNLSSTTREGDVWQYFKKLGIGEVQIVFVSRKKGTGSIKFTGVGPEEEKKLTEGTHAIKGRAVTCEKQPTSTSSVDSKKAKEFADKIADILAANTDWKGSCRGIEYVAAGFLCNVCKWFYKASADETSARVTHMAGTVHVMQDIANIEEKEFGIEGVYCRVCKEFVKSKEGERAMNSAYDHCTLLRHHLHVKLHKLQQNQPLPKWLDNPLYSKGKKRKFSEEPPTLEKPPEPKKTPASKPPAEVVGIPGLNIVNYGSSDEEMSDEEDAEGKGSEWCQLADDSDEEL